MLEWSLYFSRTASSVHPSSRVSGSPMELAALTKYLLKSSHTKFYTFITLPSCFKTISHSVPIVFADSSGLTVFQNYFPLLLSLHLSDKYFSLLNFLFFVHNFSVSCIFPSHSLIGFCQTYVSTYYAHL